jgi:two-component system chemotaxis response regulator CheB
MKRAGAVVIAQSPDSAGYPSMPIAAARAGADLVLPVHEIGRVLAGIVEGAPLPQAGGEPREDWTAPPLDPSPQRPDTETDRDTVTQLPPNRTVNSASARAEAARTRAVELRRRRRDLAAGQGATAQTVATARRRAEESSRRAKQARQAAKQAAARQDD